MQTPTIAVEVTLSEYVDLMRVRKDMTRADLASHLGVQPRTLATWAEQDWRVRADRIVQVCSLLSIDPKVFFPTTTGEAE
jgi:transcriptional regulator with XRE-family HTH domain